MNTFCPYDSPGPDGIYPALLRRAGKTVRGLLARIARVSLSLGQIHTDYTRSGVVFLPKAGRPIYNSPRDFRLISLPFSDLERMERLVYIYMG